MAAKSAAATIIATALRGALERTRFYRQLASGPHIVRVTLLEAKSIKGTLGFMAEAAPDAYVLANLLLGGREKASHCSVSRSRSALGYSPTWNEELRLTSSGNSSGMEHVTLNLFSKNVLTGDTFLGQAVIDLGGHPELFDPTKTRVLSVTVPIKAASFPIFALDGTKTKASSSAGQGTIKVVIHVPRIFENICGYFWNIKSSFFGAVSGEKIWVVMFNKSLFCYDSPLEAKLLRKIDCKSIAHIEESAYDKLEMTLEVVKITLSSASEENLLWGWAADSQKIRRIWYATNHSPFYILCHFNYIFLGIIEGCELSCVPKLRSLCTRLQHLHLQ